MRERTKMKVNDIIKFASKLKTEYKSVFEIINNTIIVIDSNFQILFMNKQNDHYLNFHVLEQLEKFKDSNKDILEWIERIDEKSTIRIVATNIYDFENNHIGFILAIDNISELMRLKKARAIDNDLFKTTLNKARIYLWEYDIKEKSIKSLFCPDNAELEILDNDKIYYNIPDSLVEMNIIDELDKEKINELHKDIVNGKLNNQIKLKMRDHYGKQQWIKLNCATILNQEKEPVKSIAIVENIGSLVQLQTKYEIEREYREVLSEESLGYIEADLLNNKIISTRFSDNIFIDYKADLTYDQFIILLSNIAITGEQEKLVHELNSIKLLKDFRNNKRYLKLEYQLLNRKTKNYHFVRVVVFLITTKENIYSCLYFKDINDTKVKDLDLKKKAELDSLTGLYNRKSIEIKINQYIKEQSEHKFAIMILDIDNFKLINDNFGHLYGDALLCEIARKLKSIFRSDDWLARMGGDEYLIIMKNIPNIQIATEKAKAICKMIEKEYGHNQIKVKISISIGIALYPDHGNNFEELYLHSDQALYQVKDNGKNGFYLYDKKINNQLYSLEERKKTIDKRTNNLAINNINNYIFRILHATKDLKTTINAVLELLGMHYDMKQSLLIIKDLQKNKYRVINSWKYDNEIKNSLVNILMSKNNLEYYNLFNENGILWIDGINKLDENNVLKKIYQGSKINSVIQCIIKSDDRVIGLLSLEHQDLYHYTSEDQENILLVISIITTFVIKRHYEEEKKIAKKFIGNIFAFQKNSVYLVDRETLQLLDYNDSLKKHWKNIQLGNYCYHELFGIHRQCNDCPLKKINDSNDHYSDTFDYYGTELKRSTQIIKWITGNELAIISWTDDKKN